MLKLKELKRRGIIHYPNDWLFKEYLSLLGMYTQSINVEFNPEEIKKIRVIKKDDNYILIAENKKTYVADVNKEFVNIQIYEGSKLIHDERISVI